MKEQKIDLKFQIKGVETLDFSLRQQSEALPAQAIFNFNINVKQQLNPDKKLVFVLVNVILLNEDKKSELGNIIVSTIFSIDNFHDIVIKKENNTYQVPEVITDLLNSISISTTRGVMATTFKGTFLHNAILPVVNPKDLKVGKH